MGEQGKMPTINLQVKRLIRDCPNTRLHILFALWGFNSPPTATDISMEIPMDRGQVGVHLHGLESDGYVFRQGQRWYLTSKGQQIPLPGLARELTEESVENSRTLCSSSLIDTGLLTPSSLKLQLQQPKSVENSRTLPPSYALLIPYFLDKIGPANKALENALQHAADAGDDPAEIATRIEEWSAYLGSEKAKGIQNPGAFVAKMITNAQNTPDWFSAWLTRERGPKHFGHDWREWLAENGYCVRCASDPCQCETSEGQHESVTNL